jgi:hypothetical protein
MQGQRTAVRSDRTARVQVWAHGLVSAPQHNGERGRIVSGPDAASGRYTVQLDAGGNTLGLRAANLALVSPEPTAADPPEPALEPEPEPEFRPLAAALPPTKAVDGTRKE